MYMKYCDVIDVHARTMFAKGHTLAPLKYLDLCYICTYSINIIIIKCMYVHAPLLQTLKGHLKVTLVSKVSLHLLQGLLLYTSPSGWNFSLSWLPSEPRLP